MRPYILVYLFLTTIALSAQNRESKEYTLSGKINSDNAPQQVYLSYRRVDSKTAQLDSCLIKDGMFCFKDTLPYTLPATITTTRNLQTATDRFDFYLDPANQSITSDGSLRDARIEGSPTTTLYQTYLSLQSAFEKEGERLQQTYQQAKPARQTNKQFKDSLNRWAYDIQQRYDDMSIGFISQHPNNLLGVYMLLSEISTRPANERIEPAFLSLSDSIRQTIPGKKLAALIEKNRTLPIGQPAPDFTLNDQDGHTVRLSDFRGKHVLLNFWSPECDNCLKEMQQLKEIHRTFGHQDFVILNIAVISKELRDKWLETIAREELEWTNLTDLQGWTSPVTRQYKVHVTPFNYLIDPNGNILAPELYGASLMLTLNRIFQ